MYLPKLQSIDTNTNRDRLSYRRMTDLEERILKKNVPGKFTQWDESDETTDKIPTKYEKLDVQHDAYTPNGSSSALTKPKRSTNTGPKGVLQDYHDVKQMEALQLATQKIKKQ